MIKLNELEAMRKAMTPGLYTRGQWQYEVRPEGIQWTRIAPSDNVDASIVVVEDPPALGSAPRGSIIGGCGCCGSPEGTAADVDGLVATHNAADVLIEIAKATKKLQVEGWDFRSTTMDALLAVLSKVRL